MTDSSNKAVNESISAVVDGEGGELDLRRILNASDNPEVRETWRRYHLQHAIQNGDIEEGGFVDLSDSIRAAIEQEDTPQIEAPIGQSNVSSFTRWKSGMAKMAIAASVAFAFLFGVQQYNVSGTDGTLVPVESSTIAEHNGSSAVVPAGFEQPSLNARTVSSVVGGQAPKTTRPSIVPAGRVAQNRTPVAADPELQAYINELLFKHAEQASASNGLSVMPFARVSQLEDNSEE